MNWQGYKKSVDKVQSNIVQDLKKMGISVLEINCELDLLVGYNNKNYIFEIKDPKYISKKTGKILQSAYTESQKTLLKEWQGDKIHVITNTQQAIDILFKGK